MFGNRHYAVLLQSLGICYCLAGHPLWVLAEGAAPDNRVGRIGMNIDRGGEIDMDTHLAALTCHLVAIKLYRLLILYRSDHLVARVGGGIGQTHGQAPLAI